jgi:uncharacterized membrane protein HdeD (DUF308 family)
MLGEAVEVLLRKWWVFAIQGAAALIFGILTIMNPALTVAALILLFGAYAVANGVFAIFSALANRRGERHWGTLLATGILSVALGLLTLFIPSATAIVLLYLIAAWAIVTGVGEIMAAIRLRKVITGEWLLLLAGVLSVVAGVLLIVFPGAGALAVAVWIGAYAIVLGILLIALGFRLRSWGRAHGVGEGAAA